MARKVEEIQADLQNAENTVTLSAKAVSDASKAKREAEARVDELKDELIDAVLNKGKAR